MVSRSTLVTAVLLVLTTSVSGQVIPKGFDKVEGDHFSDKLGIYGIGRMQVVEGELIGMPAAIGRISYRRDNTRQHFPNSNIGRTWTRVTVDASDIDMAKVSVTFAKNIQSKRTRVFDAKFSLPSYPKGPTQQPAPFASALSFQLSTSFLSRGKLGVLFDWVYRGGTLANGARWVTNNGSTNAPYYVDGVFAAPSSGIFSSYGTFVPIPRQNGCNDSAHRFRNDAQTTVGVTVYGPSYQVRAFAGTTVFSVSSAFTARGAPVLHVVSNSGSDRGVNIGARCQKLYVAFNGTYVPALQTTMTTLNAFSGVASRRITTIPSLVGTMVGAQSAWADSGSGRFSLTTAMRAQVPPIPGSRKVPLRASIYRNDLSNPRGFWIGWHGTHNLDNPLVRYSAK